MFCLLYLADPIATHTQRIGWLFNAAGDEIEAFDIVLSKFVDNYIYVYSKIKVNRKIRGHLKFNLLKKLGFCATWGV